MHKHVLIQFFKNTLKMEVWMFPLKHRRFALMNTLLFFLFFTQCKFFVPLFFQLIGKLCTKSDERRTS